MVFSMILVGIIAFSLCAECPFDACGHAFCGGADGSRPTGRLAFKLTGVFLAAASMGLGLHALTSSWFSSAASAFACESVPLRASSLRI